MRTREPETIYVLTNHDSGRSHVYHSFRFAHQERNRLADRGVHATVVAYRRHKRKQ